MKKIQKTRVIQITGLRGLIAALFTAVCFAAGFGVFPGYAAMKAWNWAASLEALANYIPHINLYQGLLLWAIVALLFRLSNNKNKHFMVFHNISGLTEDEMKQVMDKIKVQSPVITKKKEQK
jgi:hypothetical protein